MGRALRDGGVEAHAVHVFVVSWRRQRHFSSVAHTNARPHVSLYSSGGSSVLHVSLWTEYFSSCAPYAGAAMR